jgi:hypothetical protein
MAKLRIMRAARVDGIQCRGEKTMSLYICFYLLIGFEMLAYKIDFSLLKSQSAFLSDPRL